MERQLRAEEVESNGLCWEWKLKAEVVESVFFGVTAQSRMVESAVFGAAARSQMVESVVFGVAAQS